MDLVTDILDYWKETWRDDRFLFWVELGGTVLGMAASLVLNIYVTNPIMLVVLSLYVVSAVMLAYGGYKRRSSSIFVLMSFYTIVSVFGLINLLC